jgi:manganese/iron transport system permease protein/iron/zinc/copper transport system permease protein
MDTLFNLLIAPLQEAFFQKSLIGGSVVAVVSGVVGCLVVLRRMSFLGDALSHALIAGVAGGYLFMKLLFGIEAHAPAMLIGSLIAAVLTVVLIGFVSRVSRIKEDTAIGIMYTGVFAAGVVVVSIFRNYIHIDLMHFIMGDVLGVADADLWASTIISAAVLTVILLFFRYFQITSFDPVMAISIGMPVVLIDYVLTTCVSLVVVSAVSMVGVILVVGLLITPAATAYLLSDRLDRMMLLSAFFGVTSVIGGLYLCIWLDSAGGGAIMLFCTLQFLVVLVIAPRYGMLARLLQRRRMVPQQDLEDILAALYRHGPLSQTDLNGKTATPRKSPRSLNNLALQGFLTLSSGMVELTERGRTEAQRIIRSHRLWETYLEHVGVPETEIHQRAEHLEHMHDNSAMEYLDDLLGHPEHDPHGRKIPEDEACNVHDRPVPLSYYHSGRSGIVAKLLAAAHDLGLKDGERITMRERIDNGATWVIEKTDGSRMNLDHHQADAVLVRCAV